VVCKLLEATVSNSFSMIHQFPKQDSFLAFVVEASRIARIGAWSL
jgi:hypothetical protein